MPIGFFGITVNNNPFTRKDSETVVERQEKKFCYPSLSFEKEDTLIILCQLEIDHVTQQTKEACQRTCRGPKQSSL